MPCFSITRELNLCTSSKRACKIQPSFADRVESWKSRRLIRVSGEWLQHRPSKANYLFSLSETREMFAWVCRCRRHLSNVSACSLEPQPAQPLDRRDLDIELDVPSPMPTSPALPIATVAGTVSACRFDVCEADRPKTEHPFKLGTVLGRAIQESVRPCSSPF